MPDPEQLRILKEGAEVWNEWREENSHLKIELQGANLSYMNLRGANLRGANLEGANLEGVNLYDVDLKGANLHSVDLSKKDLSGKDLRNTKLSNANLTKVQALRTNFSGTTFTGACIQDWNINSETNLDNVICDYVYLKEEQQERCPSDPHKNFKSGEFTKLVQHILETVDLIFSEGIDWKAFLTSFQKLQSEDTKWELTIQAIENKSNGSFMIRVEVPPKTDKAEVAKYLKQEYEVELQALEEIYRLQLEDREIELHKQNSANIMKMAELMAVRNPLSKIVDVQPTADIKYLLETYQSKYDSNTANFSDTVDVAKSESHQQVTEIKYISKAKQTLAEAVAEKEQLQKQLKQADSNSTDPDYLADFDKVDEIDDEITSGDRSTVTEQVEPTNSDSSADFKPVVEIENNTSSGDRSTVTEQVETTNFDSSAEFEPVRELEEHSNSSDRSTVTEPAEPTNFDSSAEFEPVRELEEHSNSSDRSTVAELAEPTNSDSSDDLKPVVEIEENMTSGDRSTVTEQVEPTNSDSSDDFKPVRKIEEHSNSSDRSTVTEQVETTNFDSSAEFEPVGELEEHSNSSDRSTVTEPAEPTNFDSSDDFDKVAYIDKTAYINDKNEHNTTSSSLKKKRMNARLMKHCSDK